MLRKIKEKGINHYFKVLLKIVIKIIIPKYSKQLIFEIILSDYKSKRSEDSFNITIARNIEEIMPLVLKREAWYLEHAQRLFEKGNLCFIGKIKDQIVSCVWSSFREVYLPDVKYTLKVDDQIVPLIDGYTLEPFRGLGIYKAVWDYCLKYLRDQKKYESVYGFVVSENKRSLKVHHKLQLNNIVMIITYIRIFGIKLHFINNLKRGLRRGKKE